jgi:hypothetical protein
MSELVSCLIRRSLHGLVTDAPRASGIRSWIENGSFTVCETSTVDHIELTNIVLSEFISYNAFDFQRFALSSRETIMACKSDTLNPLALSWPLIKAYYSGFFAAHALMPYAGVGSGSYPYRT